MADPQTGLSASVSTAKADTQSENVTETKEDQKTQTQSVETKEQGSESTYHENPKQESQKETGQEEKLTSKDGKETPMQTDMESKSLSKVPDTKANTDQGNDDSKEVGENSKTKSDGLCGNIKQAESPETKTSLSSDATKDNNQEASLSASNMESKTTKHAEEDKKKIPDDNHSEKGLGKEPQDKQTEILESDTQKEEKVGTQESSELAGDKGEKTAPKSDDGKKSDAKNVSLDDKTDSKGSKEVGKDIGETAGTEGEIMETAENKGADNVTDVADDKDNAGVKEDTDKAAADNTEGTEDKKEGKTEADKEPDAEPEEPPVPKIPNGVAVKGKGSRRKGNPKRAVPDDTPEPSTSTAEAKPTRGQQAKKESTQPPSKKRKTAEEPRSQPTRRSKRRKFHGWGAKRKTRPARNP